MRRPKLLVALVGLAMLVAVGAIVLGPRPEQITRENFERIQKGMTRAEVEAILGSPGDYRTGPTTDPVWASGDAFITWDVHYAPTLKAWGVTEYRDSDGTVTYAWDGDAAEIWVTFNPSGNAKYAELAVTKLEQGPLNNLLWRAKRRWHRWFP